MAACRQCAGSKRGLMEIIRQVQELIWWVIKQALQFIGFVLAAAQGARWKNWENCSMTGCMA
jgi:hypothetical protein